MNTSEIKVGTKVMCHGFEGTVTEVCSWDNALIVVRLNSGTVCVGRSQFDGKYETDYIISI
jgi:preprotein translocase subunit YajC